MLGQVFDVRKGLRKLAKAKDAARRDQLGLMQRKTRCQKFWSCFVDTVRNRFLRTFCPCTIYDRDRHLRRLRLPKTICGQLWYDGTYENQMLKSVLGFISGHVLALLWMGVMVYTMNFSYLTATITCSIISCILSLGLAFSSTMRCLTLLSLPQLFSSKGRAVLMAVCLVMVVNGPINNFHYNVNVLSGIVSCGQQMTTNMTEEVVSAALTPVKDILGSINSVIASLKQLSERLRDAVLKIKDLFIEVLQAIQRVSSWLENMVDLCNDKMGEPYLKCSAVFDNAIEECKLKLGPIQGICQIVKAISWVCETTRIGEFLCQIPAAVKQHVTNKVTSGIKFALKDVYDMFYFDVNLTYHYDINLEQSKTYEEVKEGIQAEIDGWIYPVLWSTRLFSHLWLFNMSLLLIFKAYQYRRKFLRDDQYDNFYLTWHLQDIDDQRLNDDKETILPLNENENARYISVCTTQLTKHEHQKLIIGMILFSTSCCYIAFQLVLDAGLWWLLNMIRTHGALRTSITAPAQVKMHVQGEGVLADMFRAMITEFDPITTDSVMLDTSSCLPNPSPPDFSVYRQICYIIVACIILQLTQSYGLRLRHIVAGCYHPEREKVRAVWLYNDILKRRESFTTALRQKVHSQKKMSDFEEEHGALAVMTAKFAPLGKVLQLFGLGEFMYCLACGNFGKPDNTTDFVQCDNHGCKAVYCNECYAHLHNLCSACLNPVTYGEFTDSSEEMDSSDEATIRRHACHKRQSGRSLENMESTSTSSSSSSSSALSSSSDSTDDEQKKDLDQLQEFDKEDEEQCDRQPSRSRHLDLVLVDIFQSQLREGQQELSSDSSEEVVGTPEAGPLLRV